MTVIIGFSARKSGGKDTSANFILGSLMKKHGLVNEFKITPQGKLYIYGWVNGATEDGILDYDANTQFVSNLKKNYLDKYIRLYSFADCLKKDLCMKMFGLTYEQCYGTDEQKNTLTHLKWENMPGVLNPESANDLLWQAGGASETAEEIKYYFPGVTLHKPGFMTAREVMQILGTEVCRKIYGDCHVNATIGQIKIHAPEVALIRDVRFVNEVEGTQNNGGYVVRLLRDPNEGKDKHESETALDDYPLENYFAVVDNREMSVPEQNDAIKEVLQPVIDL